MDCHTEAGHFHNQTEGKLKEKKIIKKATDRQKGVPAFPRSRTPRPTLSKNQSKTILQNSCH